MEYFCLTWPCSKHAWILSGWEYSFTLPHGNLFTCFRYKWSLCAPPLFLSSPFPFEIMDRWGNWRPKNLEWVFGCFSVHQYKTQHVLPVKSWFAKQLLWQWSDHGQDTDGKHTASWSCLWGFSYRYWQRWVFAHPRQTLQGHEASGDVVQTHHSASVGQLHGTDPLYKLCSEMGQLCIQQTSGKFRNFSLMCRFLSPWYDLVVSESFDDVTMKNCKKSKK